MSVQAGPAALLERGGDLRAVDEALDRVAGERSGRVIVFEAAAGLGKTSLLAGARASARRRGLRVAAAVGMDLEQDYAWGVVRQLFAPFSELLQDRPRYRASGLARRLLLGGEDALDPQQGEYALMHSLLWLTTDLAEPGPLVLVVDDLHWADTPSLRFLTYLAARVDELPVVVVGAMRPGSERGRSILSVLVGQPPVELRGLRALSVEATAGYLTETLPQPPDQRTVDRCYALTRGNPLLLRELGRHLAQAGDLEDIGDSWDVSVAGVERYVRLQLSRLPERATEVLGALAVLGDQTSADRLAAVAGLPVVSVLEDLSILRDDGLVTGADRLHAPVRHGVFSVSHPLIRASVYDIMRETDRVRWHARAARVAWEAGEIERSAAHLLRVPPGYSDLDVGAVLEQAAGLSIARGSPEGAVGYLRRRLEETGTDRVEGLMRLGQAELLGDMQQAYRDLSTAQALNTDPQRRVQLTVLQAASQMYGGEPVEGYKLLRAELDRPQALPDDQRRAIEALALLMSMQAPTGQDLPDALRRLGSLPPTDSIGGTMLDALLGFGYSFQCDRRAALDHALRALSDDAMLGEMITEGVKAAVWYVLTLCDEPRVLESLDTAMDVARSTGSLVGLATVGIFRGGYLWDRGDLGEALGDLRTAWEASVTGSLAIAFPHVARTLIPVLVACGELGEAEAIERQVRAAHTGVSRMVDGDGVLTLLLAQGRFEETLTLIEVLRKDCAEHAMRNPLYCDWRGALVRCLHALNRDEEGQAIAEEALVAADAWGTPRARGRALRTAAIVHTGERQIDLLAESVAVLTDADARYELAQSRFALGDALRRAKQMRDARTHLQGALNLAELCGATPLQTQAAKTLRLIGARPATGVNLGPGYLTPGETRVVELAAQGLTNREIAQSLFVTIKTVEVHLSNAFRKLGISNRRKLAHAISGQHTKIPG